MNVAEELFRTAMREVLEKWHSYHFFTERDIEWTIQRKLIALVKGRGLDWQVFNNYAMPKQKPGEGKLQADLAVVSETGAAKLAVEFKYEPDHKREDIPEGKLKPSVVSWPAKDSSVSKGILLDAERVKTYRQNRQKKGMPAAAHFVLIDEGGEWKRKNRRIPDGAEWFQWGERLYVLSTISLSRTQS